MIGKTQVDYPVDPLEDDAPRKDDPEFARRVVQGILESYNDNYDFFAESLQNAVDAVEDAVLLDLPEPHLIRVTVDLSNNTFAVLDTGVAMDEETVVAAYRPHVSMKPSAALAALRTKGRGHRGYKGVGLTFVAYGTNALLLHSKRDGVLTKTMMHGGRDWALGNTEERPRVYQDQAPSPLEEHDRGTYVQVTFSSNTRPRSLASIGPAMAWEAILRTRTALGQVLLGRDPVAKLQAELVVVDIDGVAQHSVIEPTFYLPHYVEREPPYKFLDLVEYFRKYSERSEPPSDKQRQDGIYFQWDSARILEAMTDDERERLAPEVEQYDPLLYAFIPYQGGIWRQMRETTSGRADRRHLEPGLVIAIDRQRIGRPVDFEPTRNADFSRNMFAVVHFDGARPDQGRKTVQDDVLELAKVAANRGVQYLAGHKHFLRPGGEAPTPDQRRVEKNHQDWVVNVHDQREKEPIDVPFLPLVSAPRTEQDVVALFHELASLGVFPGIKVSATSQMKTYDSLVCFECDRSAPGLAYKNADTNALGLAPFLLGEDQRFETRELTLEYKISVDGLIEDLARPQSNKAFQHIDLCVVWSKFQGSWPGYELLSIQGSNLEDRKYPGVTHILMRDRDTHVVQLVMLEKVIDLLVEGAVPFGFPSTEDE